MSASLLPEVRDEFERSFEQKEAPKVVETNREGKEQVKSVELLWFDAWLVLVLHCVFTLRWKKGITLWFVEFSIFLFYKLWSPVKAIL